jgi:hypothetical protein
MKYYYRLKHLFTGHPLKPSLLADEVCCTQCEFVFGVLKTR